MRGVIDDTRDELAGCLERAGQAGDAGRFRDADGDVEARALARDLAERLRQDGRDGLGYAFAAWELALRHAGQPGLEDIAERNLRSARRLAGLAALEPATR